MGGICGALLTNLSAWLSGVWFELDLLGDAFRKIACSLPFVHAVELERQLICGDLIDIGLHLFPVVAYSILVSAAAVACFLRQMKKQ